MKPGKIVTAILYAIPLAMGIATVVLASIGEIELKTLATLLGISIASISIAGLESVEKD